MRYTLKKTNAFLAFPRTIGVLKIGKTFLCTGTFGIAGIVRIYNTIFYSFRKFLQQLFVILMVN